jgi:cell division protein FtsQ
VGLVFLAVTSPLLDVDAVRVVGTQHMNAADVIAVAHVRRHDPLLFVDTGAVARRVEQMPWVAHASVRREWPGTIRIAVTEYTPSAYVRVANAVLLVAPDGRIVARASAAPAGTIEIRGVHAPPAIGDLLAPPDAAGIAARVPAELARQVVAVNIDGGGLALVLARGGEVRFANGDDVAAKSQAALAVLAHLGAAAHFSYVDVSTPDRPVVHD